MSAASPLRWDDKVLRSQATSPQCFTESVGQSYFIIFPWTARTTHLSMHCINRLFWLFLYILHNISHFPRAAVPLMSKFLTTGKLTYPPAWPFCLRMWCPVVGVPHKSQPSSTKLQVVLHHMPFPNPPRLFQDTCCSLPPQWPLFSVCQMPFFILIIFNYSFKIILTNKNSELIIYCTTVSRGI